MAEVDYFVLSFIGSVIWYSMNSVKGEPTTTCISENMQVGQTDVSVALEQFAGINKLG
jgi:hypothetical protein